MDLLAALESEPFLLTEGAVVERLRRDPRVSLDPVIAHAAFIYDGQAAAVMEAIYREYMTIAREFAVPMLSLTPTWRADPERLARAGLQGRDVNGDAVRFLRRLAGESGARIAIGALMGCHGDAYKPDEALSEREAAAFHLPQARALAAARPDFLFASTLPAASEARGLARAMACCGQPYLLSFVINADGELLDGTPLGEAIASIDRDVHPAPLGYFVNCIHSSVLKRALDGVRPPRLIGFQANTSALSPDELNELAELQTEEPEVFAAGVAELHSAGFRIFGGCCGTFAPHIRNLASTLVRINRYENCED